MKEQCNLIFVKIVVITGKVRINIRGGKNMNKKTIKLISTVLLIISLCLNMIPAIGSVIIAQAEGNENERINYRRYNTYTKKFENSYIEDYTLITEDDLVWGVEGKETWYVFNPDNPEIVFNDRITVNGTVNLIVCDNKILTARKGISVNEESSIRIFAQSTKGNMGKIRAGVKNLQDEPYAGIGGDVLHSAGNITINGCDIIAYGSGGANSSFQNISFHGSAGAGIGGGEGGKGGVITINGGNIYAESCLGAGIGGGSVGAGGIISINGGNVETTVKNGAGIGGGIYGSGGTITINDGDIIVKDPSGLMEYVTESGSGLVLSGAGIGAGCNVTSSLSDDALLNRGNYSMITINGGNIYSESNNGASIGLGNFGSDSYYSTLTIMINGGEIKVNSINGKGIGYAYNPSIACIDGDLIINGGKLIANRDWYNYFNTSPERGISNGISCENVTINGGETETYGLGNYGLFGHTINIYGGSIISKGRAFAGIYGSDFNIYGGIVNAESKCSAGIGRSDIQSASFDDYKIKIYGGIIETKGGCGAFSSPGIGTEYPFSYGTIKGSITFYSGIVKSTVTGEGADCIGGSSGVSEEKKPIISFRNGTADVTAVKDDYFYDVTEDKTRTIKRICKVSIADSIANSVSADNVSPYCYDTVTLTIDDSIDPDKLAVEYDDERLKLTKVDDDTYTFTVPEGDVTICYKGYTATVTMEGWNYGDTPKQPVLGEESNPGNAEVTYEYFVDEDCITKTTPKDNGSIFEGGCPSKAGTYYVKATIAQSDSYDEETAVAAFTIAKLKVTPNIPTEKSISVQSTVTKLSEIELPEGWVWQADADLPMAEKISATAVYVGEDSGNYETESVDIEIYRECDHSQNETRDKVEETCTSDGYSGDVYCKICNTLLSSGEIVSAKGHKWGTWQVTTPASIASEGVKTRECENCDATDTETIDKLNEDDVGIKELVVETMPSKTVYIEGEAFDATGMVVKKIYNNDEEAICTDYTVGKIEGTGEVAVSISKGNVMTTVNITVNHDLTEIGANAETCTENGNNKYYKCSVCNKYFSGEDTKTEIAKNSWVIVASGHSWSAWKETKTATTTQNGEKKRTCSKCGKTETEVIPKQQSKTGIIKTTGIYCASNYPSIQAGINIQKSNETDTVEYRWVGCNNNEPDKWFEISPWTKNNNWMDWTPDKSGGYVFVCYARVVGNEDASEIQCAFGTEYHKEINAVCQMPYTGEGGGYLIGIESRDNPNNKYKYEILILDCNLYLQGKNAWVYTSGKCGAQGNSMWTLWQPQYGYYWTLFRIYDENDNLIDEVCYGFENVN